MPLRFGQESQLARPLLRFVHHSLQDIAQIADKALDGDLIKQRSSVLQVADNTPVLLCQIERQFRIWPILGARSTPAPTAR